MTSEKSGKASKPGHAGHRQRLKERFLKAGAGQKLGITLHDHLIMTRDGHSLFKAMGLL